MLVTSHTRFFIASLVISTTQLGLLAFVLAHFSLRLWVAARSGRAWSRRRKRISMLSFAQLLARVRCWGNVLHCRQRPRLLAFQEICCMCCPVA